MVTLRRIDDDVLDTLVAVAVADTEPDDVVPATDDSPGWTAERIEALRSYHRHRHAGLDGPHREVTLAILSPEHEVVGAARLHAGGDGLLEAGLWLRRAARGRGLGGAVMAALVDEARTAGGNVMVAETTTDNAPALAALRGVGATLGAPDRDGKVLGRVALRGPS